MEQIYKKKKKKKAIDGVDVFTFEEEIVDERIEAKMRNHIGRKNACTLHDLFYCVYGKKVEDFNPYLSIYLWNYIKKRISYIKKTGGVFIVVRRNTLFVLQTENELKIIKKSIDARINGLYKLRVIADDWVMDEKWRDL